MLLVARKNYETALFLLHTRRTIIHMPSHNRRVRIFHYYKLNPHNIVENKKKIFSLYIDGYHSTKSSTYHRQQRSLFDSYCQKPSKHTFCRVAIWFSFFFIVMRRCDNNFCVLFGDAFESYPEDALVLGQQHVAIKVTLGKLSSMCRQYSAIDTGYKCREMTQLS